MDIKKYYHVENKKIAGHRDYKIYEAVSVKEKTPVSIHVIRKTHESAQALHAQSSALRNLSDMKYFPQIYEIFESDSSFLVVTRPMKPCSLKDQIRAWGPLSKSDWGTVAEAILLLLWRFNKEFPELVGEVSVHDFYVVAEEMGEFCCYLSPVLVMKDTHEGNRFSALFEELLFEMRTGVDPKDGKGQEDFKLLSSENTVQLDATEKNLIRKIRTWNYVDPQASDLDDFFNCLWSGFVCIDSTGPRAPGKSQTAYGGARRDLIRLTTTSKRPQAPVVYVEHSPSEFSSCRRSTVKFMGLKEGCLLALDEEDEEEEAAEIDSPNLLPISRIQKNLEDIRLTDISFLDLQSSSSFISSNDEDSSTIQLPSDKADEECDDPTPRSAFNSCYNPRLLLRKERASM
eukprot:CAMPEP_0115043986 /NCGR_PEP_ID=MMETSP0216-20121206/47196_1 /TAXON_ID=223996 /ORGANISM="Protocruzia adherens, Strain Boccale" /LENGTH=400 /DNA_ID=CAMNT_0002426413 /DNA_START=360 /DNA_END=1562 /DNA_ORIENTATION=-